MSSPASIAKRACLLLPWLFLSSPLEAQDCRCVDPCAAHCANVFPECAAACERGGGATPASVPAPALPLPQLHELGETVLGMTRGGRPARIARECRQVGGRFFRPGQKVPLYENAEQRRYRERMGLETHFEARMPMCIDTNLHRELHLRGSSSMLAFHFVDGRLASVELRVFGSDERSFDDLAGFLDRSYGQGERRPTMEGESARHAWNFRDGWYALLILEDADSPRLSLTYNGPDRAQEESRDRRRLL